MNGLLSEPIKPNQSALKIIYHVTKNLLASIFFILIFQ
jgi:hypothetical protein